MNRSLKIALILCSVGVTLIAFAALAVFLVVGDFRRAWDTSDRASRDEGVSVGKGTNDAGCFERAIERLREGRAGAAGVRSRPWIQGCFASATPTVEFCADAPPSSDTEASLRWQGERCATKGFAALSLCGAVADEAQTYCETRTNSR